MGPVKGKDGNISTKASQVERWVQYFQEDLKRPVPHTPANPLPADEDLDISRAEATDDEVLASIKAIKWGKAPGIDSVYTELLRADVETSTKVLTILFNTI